MSLGNEVMTDAQYWKRQYENLCRKYDALEAKSTTMESRGDFLEIELKKMKNQSFAQGDFYNQKELLESKTTVEIQNLIIKHRDNLINDLVKQIIKLKRENQNAESNDNNGVQQGNDYESKFGANSASPSN